MKDFETWLRHSPATDTRLSYEEIFKPLCEWEFGDRMLCRTDGSEHVFEEAAYADMLGFLEKHMPHRTKDYILARVQQRMPDLWLWAGR